MGKSQLEIFLRGFSRRLRRHKALSNSDPASFAANFHSMQKSFAHAVVRFCAFVAVSPRKLLTRIIVMVDLNEQFWFLLMPGNPANSVYG